MKVYLVLIFVVLKFNLAYVVWNLNGVGSHFIYFLLFLKLGTTFHLTFQSVYFETLCDFDMDYFPGKGPFDLEMQGVASCSNGQGKARVRMRTESSPPTPALILQYSSSIRFAKNVLECTSTTKALSSVWHEIGVIQMSCPCQGYKPSSFRSS